MPEQKTVKDYATHLLRAVEAQGIGAVMIVMIRNDGTVGTVGAAFPNRQEQLDRLDQIITEAFPKAAVTEKPLIVM
jgi:hypothetical protein